MIRALGWSVVLAAAAAAGFMGHAWLVRPLGGTPADPVHHRTAPGQGPTLEQVQKLSSLVTLRVPISDVQVSELEGFTGGLKVAIAVHGDVEIATDLSTARFEEMDQENRTAVLVLVRPSAVRPRLDHEKTRVIEYQRSGLWWWVNGQAGEDVLTSRAMVHAQRALLRAAQSPDLRAQACEHTQHVIHEFFAAMAWNVSIRWRDADPPAPRA